VTVCGSDVHYYEHGRIGDFVVEAPLVLGHECSGTVVGHGPGAGRHPVGALVAVEPGVPCGRCGPCRAGTYNLCPDVRFLATPPVDGAFTEYLVVHEDFLHAVPDGTDAVTAALVEPTAVAVWANRKAAVGPGDRVLVTGAGPIGLLCAAVAAARGAPEVVVSDVSVERLERAAEFGATATVHARELAGHDRRYTVLLECSGVEAALRDGLAGLRPAGRAVLVGMAASGNQNVPVGLVQSRELSLVGTFRYANAYPEAIDLIRSGRVTPGPLVGATFTLADAESALRVAHEDPTVLKAAVLLEP
jgi:L-iditol 2-dehydrogenase